MAAAAPGETLREPIERFQHAQTLCTCQAFLLLEVDPATDAQVALFDTCAHLPALPVSLRHRSVPDSLQSGNDGEERRHPR